MITLKIDGKAVQIEKGATILAAAEKAGIRIPTLCFLKKVSPTGACRICAVEVAGADKTMTACNTPAEEGMEITTQSPRLQKIRRQVIELLLVNHPLDCPVCDAAGECDLQNICYAHDVTQQPFAAEDVNEPTITAWPLIEQVPNRCVMCEKCVKVCHEVVGADSLYVNQRGDRAFIDKHLDKCVFCGNCVQVCPTGTMISKPFKFQARCWELTKVPSNCPSCGSQCQIDLNVKNNRLYRVTSEDGATINDGTLCFNGFFGFDYVHAPQRLTAPLLKEGAVQRPAGWEEALAFAASRLKAAGANAAGIAGTRLTNEEGFLFQTLFRKALASNHFDTEARFGVQRAYQTLHAQFGMKGGTARLDRIGRSQAVLVIGADPTAEAPAVDWLTQKASRMCDGKLVVANARATRIAEYANVPLTCRPGSEGVLATAIAASLVNQGLADEAWLQQHVKNLSELRAQLGAVDIAQAAVACGVEAHLIAEAAQLLGAAASVAVIFGGDICRDAQAEATLGAIANLALVSGALAGPDGGIFPIGAGGNSQGLFDMGVACDVLPGGEIGAATGRSLAGILEGIEAGEIKALYLAAVNPLFFPESNRWRKALEKLDCLIVHDILASEASALAHVVLPGAAFAEKSGTITSSGHRTSDLAKAIAPCGAARADVEILGALIERIAPNQVLTAAALQSEVLRCSAKATFAPAPGSLSAAKIIASEPASAGPVLIAGKNLYYAAATNAHSAASKEVVPGGYLEINVADAKAWGIADGDRIKATAALGILEGPARVSTAVPQGVVFAPLNCPDVNVQQILPFGANTVVIKVGKA